jgi:ergothioneine biosynthesis protein EgtB
MAAPASTSQPASREGLSRLAVNYRAVRGASERLSALLTAEDHMVQSASEASPTKWHLAHTTWFFETFVLAPHVDGYRHFDRRFTYLFNSYYKQVEGHPLRSIRGTFSRPSLEEVRAYRRHVDGAMEALLENSGAPIATLVELGLNHEQQHQELIVTDIKHAFWTNPVRPSLTSGKEASAATAPAEWREFAGGTFEIGYSGEDFAFDNETPRHQVLLRPYRLCSRLTRNSEYIEFIEAGGYSRPELWLSEGWDHINTNKWHAPFYWEKQDGEWWVFTSSGMQLLDPAEPVCHISYYEADAYARWRGCRLPTEAEWEIAAGAEPIRGNFAETGLFHPMPANGRGLQQMFGDVWEWTASPYVAYPGYCAPGGALGEYNGKFMCNQIVLRGGSCATPQSHIRGTYRNFFPAHTRWQFMGVRLADDCA